MMDRGLLHRDGKEYAGEWKSGEKHGHGTESYPGGKKRQDTGYRISMQVRKSQRC
jgi:hypothetical protein